MNASTDGGGPASASASASGRKRPHSPDQQHDATAGGLAATTTTTATSPNIPEGDLTVDRLEDFLDLSDRENICWALQTESRVRLQKVETRDDFNVSETLDDGGYLFDVYPMNAPLSPEEEDWSSGVALIERDRRSYHRRSREFLRTVRDLDESWDALASIDVIGYDRDANSLHAGQARPPPSKADTTGKPKANPAYVPAAVPPNMLFFRIIMEGYMGYSWPAFHPGNADYPRCAVMGGAVLASLTAWRKPGLVRIFEKAEIEACFDDSVEYAECRKRLVKAVNDYFAFSSQNESAFADGDVDVFLQASPTTRNLMQHIMSQGMKAALLPNIADFIGGIGFAQNDLYNMAKEVSRKSFETIINAISDGTKDYAQERTGFVYALAQNGLSAQLAVFNDVLYGMREMPWPRSTQIIMLKPQADLLGGLLDFDISAVACAYDGNGVYVTPRASLSLVTLAQVVTPFVLSEERNRKRIIKYWKRGFNPYLVDANCTHPYQCSFSEEMRMLERGLSPYRYYNDEVNEYRRAVTELKDHPSIYSILDGSDGRPSYDEVVAFQENNINGTQFCCAQPGCRARCGDGRYSMVLFEKKEGDAMEFLANDNNWTSEWQRQVHAVDPRGRLVCAPCRHRYIMHKVLKKCIDADIWRDDDSCLHDEFASHGWKRKNPTRVFAGYDFYCGATFDSRLARRYSRDKNCALSTLQAKENMESMRYIVKHGTEDGYKLRFVFDDDLDQLFLQASLTALASSSRAPVGLNPERFIARCRFCSKWLEDCEYNVKVCELCASQKLEGGD